MKADNDTLMRQAPETAKVYLIEALETVRKTSRMDMATAIIVAALVLASSLDYLAAVVATDA